MTRQTYKNRPRTQRQLSLIDWAAKPDQTLAPAYRLDPLHEILKPKKARSSMGTERALVSEANILPKKTKQDYRETDYSKNQYHPYGLGVRTIRVSTMHWMPSVRHVQRLGVRSASLAMTITELAGLNVGTNYVVPLKSWNACSMRRALPGASVWEAHYE